MMVRRLDENHDMNFGHGLADFLVDANAVAQNVKTRLYLIAEEWFLDINAGVPYLQKMLVKPDDLTYVEAVIKKTILETPGVIELLDFSLVFNRETRQLSIAASYSQIYGGTNTVRI